MCVCARARVCAFVCGSRVAEVVSEDYTSWSVFVQCQGMGILGLPDDTGGSRASDAKRFC